MRRWIGVSNGLLGVHVFFYLVTPTSTDSEAGIAAIRCEISRLTPAYEDALAIGALVEKRADFIAQMKRFEVSASDPARLFRSSFQLNQEERFRKTAYPTLMRLERELVQSLRTFAATHNFPYRQTFLADFEQEIADRFISEIFFSFDESVTQRKLKVHVEDASSAVIAADSKAASKRRSLDKGLVSSPRITTSTKDALLAARK